MAAPLPHEKGTNGHCPDDVHRDAAAPAARRFWRPRRRSGRDEKSHSGLLEGADCGRGRHLLLRPRQTLQSNYSREPAEIALIRGSAASGKACGGISARSTSRRSSITEGGEAASKRAAAKTMIPIELCISLLFNTRRRSIMNARRAAWRDGLPNARRPLAEISFPSTRPTLPGDEFDPTASRDFA